MIHTINSFRNALRRFACLACIALIPACNQSSNSGASVRDQMRSAQSQPPATAASNPSAPRAAASRPIATVNGLPIERKDLIEILLRARGLTILQQMILRETALQELHRKGFTLTEADIDQEYEYTLQADQFNGKDPDKLTPTRREQLIADWIRSRGVSRDELRMVMERQACLRRLVAEQIQIDDKMLRGEFDRTYGEKVEVRHIQLEAPRYFPQIKQRLERGEKFEDLARQFSANILSKERGGLLPPFTAADDSVPGVFIKAAFQLQVGEYTNPIEAEGSYHVLKLEKRIPAESAVFDDVREKLTRHLRARLTVTAMQELGSRLLMQAELRIEDPTLRDQYRKLQAAREIEGPVLIGQ